MTSSFLADSRLSDDSPSYDSYQIGLLTLKLDVISNELFVDFINQYGLDLLAIDKRDQADSSLILKKLDLFSLQLRGLFGEEETLTTSLKTRIEYSGIYESKSTGFRSSLIFSKFKRDENENLIKTKDFDKK